MNEIVMSGITSRVTSRTTRIKQPMLTFSLSGITPPDADGRTTRFHQRITAFGETAKNYAHMPDEFPIEITGSISIRTWTDDEGTTQRIVGVTATSITPLPTNKGLEETPGKSPRLKDATNNVGIIGKLASKPEFRFLPTGAALTRLNLEVNGGILPIDVWGEEQAIQHAQHTAGEHLQVLGVLVPMSNVNSVGDRVDTTRVEANSITPAEPEVETTAAAAA